MGWIISFEVYHNYDADAILELDGHAGKWHIYQRLAPDIIYQCQYLICY